ncbi:hypothetical protein [Salidesulfovibrio onnuriiensis]|uniref:hypothetical protein n=1 Tax=Salidesulfovibrio onnuriiensis TaxID=2583823 RepID=UPI0011CC1AE0|nr:hypothetical protein [Salidesulfovibrio onnuriiensis]
MKKLRRMPAEDCRFHLKERCLYQERLNPGYCREWRCSVLEDWERIFDEFLHRAEAFGLELREVNELWARQFDRLMRGNLECDRYEYDPGQDPPGCVWQHDGLCIPALPECSGRCRHYEVRRTKKDTPYPEEQE